MERRLSGALTLAGVVGAVAWVGLAGRRTVPTAQVDAVLAEIDGAVRETAAGTQARAVTLAQLPRLAWAVATDEATVRDLTSEELAFRPQVGEQIEIAQIEAKDNRVRRLAGIPEHSASALAIPEPGLHLVVAGDDIRVATVVKIEPKQRGKIVSGLLGVAQRLDTSRAATLLTSKGLGARLQTRSGTAALSRVAPRGSTRTLEIALRRPAAEGAKLLLSVPAGIAWGHVTGAMVLLVASIVGGRLVARRAARVVPPPPLAQPPPSEAPNDTSGNQFFESDEPTAVTETAASFGGNGQFFQGDESTAVHPEDGAHSVRNGRAPPPLPASGPPAPNNGHRPHTVFDGGESGTHQALSGPHSSAPGVQPSKPASLGVSGIVFAHGISMTMPSALFTGSKGAEARAAVPRSTNDPFDAEYQALFEEFVKLRQTCGETTEDLDRDRFVEVLHQKRVELMQRHGAKEVKFRLAFDNGRGAVRFKTIN